MVPLVLHPVFVSNFIHPSFGFNCIDLVLRQIHVGPALTEAGNLWPDAVKPSMMGALPEHPLILRDTDFSATLHKVLRGEGSKSTLLHQNS
jgi:hypothetical protein